MWIGGFLVLLLFVVLSVMARNWWPLAYLCAIFFGFGAGVLEAAAPEWFRNVYWAAFFCYGLAFPVVKVYRARRRNWKVGA